MDIMECFDLQKNIVSVIIFGDYEATEVEIHQLVSTVYKQAEEKKVH